MTDDELVDLFRGLDAPRPLPSGLRARLADDLAAAPLDGDVRDRLAATLDGGATWSELDAPRALPPATRERLASTLAASAQPPSTQPPSTQPPSTQLPSTQPQSTRWHRLGLVAASVVAVIGILAAVVVSDDTPDDLVVAPSSTTTTFGIGTGSVPATSAPSDDQATTTTTVPLGSASTTAAPATTTTTFAPSPGAAPPSGGAAPPADGAGSPPFTSSPAPPSSASAPPTTAAGQPGSGPTTTAPPSRGPLLVDITGSGDDVDGALAYLALVNERGGIDGRQVVADPSGEVVLDLDNARSDAEPRVAGRLTLGTGLVAGTFSTAGAADRLAALAVDLAIPDNAVGRRVAVYREATGPYAGAVVDDVEARVRTRGGIVVSVTWDPADPQLVAADIAIVVLDESAASFAGAADGYAPSGGIVGLGAFADPTLSLSSGFVVASPYRLVSDRSDETAALRSRVGPITVDHVHGWQAAKLLAGALYTAGDDDAVAVADALGRQDGALGGFAPYDRRPGGNTRTPDGVALRWDGTAFVAGDFRVARD